MLSGHRERFFPTARREGKAPVGFDDHEAVPLHPTHRLGHGRTGVSDAFSDARAKGRDSLFFEVNDGAQIHFCRVDKISHSTARFHRVGKP